MFNSRSKIHNFRSNSGQALVALLVFIMVGMTITSTAVSLVVANSISAQKFQDSQVALSIAESGAENAIIRMLRNPSYAGEELSLDDGTATVTVTAGNPITVTSVGRAGEFERTITVEITYDQGFLTISSWRETQ